MKISVITVTKNSAKTIERTTRSIIDQLNVSVEHVIKDANSSDNTIRIVETVNSDALLIISADKGIYDAMNQGFAASTGDIVTFLNSDDYYVDSCVLSDVLTCFEKNNCDYVYGNITMTTLNGKIVRQWVVGEIDESGLFGKQIPHPGLFIKRDVIEKLEIPFDPSYRISADLKQQLIFINKNRCSGKYLNRDLVVMQTGGESTNSVKSYLLGWSESVRAYNEVFGSGGLWFVIQKVYSKVKGIRLLAQIRYFGK